jgi:hypothetical protein
VSRPSEMSFLTRALNPVPRGRLRDSDRKALAEVRAEEDVPGNWNKFPDPLPAPGYRLSTDPHYSTLLPEPLPDEDLEPVSERLQVWALYPGKRLKMVSEHRVSPRRLYDLPKGTLPLDWQIAMAESETLRLAQCAAYVALDMGATRVEIRSYRRKAATSRFVAGPVIHGLKGILKSQADILIAGEPTEAAIAADL